MEPDRPTSQINGTPVTVTTQDPERTSSHELVMAWARDRESGVLRYILELGPERGGAQSGCECISCRLPLLAINNAKETYKQRPHFRHPAGAPKESCLVLSARAALAAAMRPGDVIFLPRRRRSSRVEGLSGEIYEAWVEQPPERVRISSVVFEDGINALLVLDDGRKLEVRLVGTADASEDSPNGIVPRILVAVDDPSIAGMPVDEIRRRLVPLLDEATWCGHWRDSQLEEQAQAAALHAAGDALDWDEDDADMPPDLRRESLLHREVKAILERARQLRLPGWTLEVERRGDIRYASSPPTTAILRAATLERRLDRIIPDVVAQLIDGSEMLIEVTVTNHVTAERLARIQAVNLPTLEIDISRMGGRITRAQLEQVVIDEIAGKVWLHHPVMEERRQELLVQLENDERLRLVRDAARRVALNTDLVEWAERYLEAIRLHADLRWEEVVAHANAHEDDVARARDEILDCAEALAVHGYPEALDDKLYDYGHTIIERLLSIKLDVGVGYKPKAGWPVINAILSDISPAAKSWHSLYLIAIKTYHPRLTTAQAQRIAEWREDVRRSIQGGEETYVRSPLYDRLLAVLFPEMREAIAHPFGRHHLPPAQGETHQTNTSRPRPSPAVPALARRTVIEKPGEDYFDGANEQRWMWAHSSEDRAEIARQERDRLLEAGELRGGHTRTILHALIATSSSSDPWAFAVTVQYLYKVRKSLTLSYIFSLDLITPMRSL